MNSKIMISGLSVAVLVGAFFLFRMANEHPPGSDVVLAKDDSGPDKATPPLIQKRTDHQTTTPKQEPVRPGQLVDKPRPDPEAQVDMKPPARASGSASKITSRTFSILRLDIKPKVNACADRFDDLLGRGSYLDLHFSVSVENETAFLGELVFKGQRIPVELETCIRDALTDLSLSVPEAEDSQDYPVSIKFDFSAR